MVKYNNSTIYKLCCKDTDIKDIYVGSTTNFNRRKQCHKSVCYNKNSKSYNHNVYNFIRNNGGWENWLMIEIIKVNCNDKRELEAKEREYIETLNATLNKYIPTRTHKEYCETNKDNIKKQRKEYCENNKYKISERHKEWREKNKNKIIEKGKEYYKNNKDMLKEKRKEYRETNKDKISEKNKIKLMCLYCNVELCKVRQKRHESTMKHINNFIHY